MLVSALLPGLYEGQVGVRSDVGEVWCVVGDSSGGVDLGVSCGDSSGGVDLGVSCGDFVKVMTETVTLSWGPLCVAVAGTTCLAHGS